VRDAILHGFDALHVHRAVHQSGLLQLARRYVRVHRPLLTVAL
jgi:hypothetical protein